MTKRSGYRIRLEWFVPFDPERPESIGAFTGQMNLAREFFHLQLFPAGGMLVNIQTKYQARREVPDAPVAVTQTTADMPRTHCRAVSRGSRHGSHARNPGGAA